MQTEEAIGADESVKAEFMLAFHPAAGATRTDVEDDVR